MTKKIKERRQRLPLKTLILETKEMVRFTEGSLWEKNDFGEYLNSKLKIMPFKLPLGRKEIKSWYMIKDDRITNMLKQAGGFVVETKADLPYSFKFFLKFTEGEDLFLDPAISQFILNFMASKLDRTPYELSIRIREELQEVGDRKTLTPDWILLLMAKNNQE